MLEMELVVSPLIYLKSNETQICLWSFLLGSDPTPSGAIVGYKEVEVIRTLVVLVSIFSDRLFRSSIMKRLLYAGCIFSALTDWLQTCAISSTNKKQLN